MNIAINLDLTEDQLAAIEARRGDKTVEQYVQATVEKAVDSWAKQHSKAQGDAWVDAVMPLPRERRLRGMQTANEEIAAAIEAGEIEAPEQPE